MIKVTTYPIGFLIFDGATLNPELPEFLK